MENYSIAIIGLGYVGLPLAMAFGEKYPVIGFDINAERIHQLKAGTDHTGEADKEALVRITKHQQTAATGIYFSNEPDALKECNIFIIAVPTPVDQANNPDLGLFKEATEIVARSLQKGNLVIYESTVYPGCTEEIAVPILEKLSGLIFNTDFFCGYSPERINPGDKIHTLPNTLKITSGSTAFAAERVDELYRSIIPAGTYLAPSIKVAEAAKVIENTQRDINIAFVNELSKIFHLMGIDTQEVLKAAATKWNFLPFHPGLVGGHCIGVDPYYLAHKSMQLGYLPEIILAARKINDSMGNYVAARVLQLMAEKGIAAKGAEVLVMGIAFKEDFADVRNSRVVDIIEALQGYHMQVTIYDPIVSANAVQLEYGLTCLGELPSRKKYDAIIIAVNHSVFSNVPAYQYAKENFVLFDVKGGVVNNFFDGKL